MKKTERKVQWEPVRALAVSSLKSTLGGVTYDPPDLINSTGTLPPVSNIDPNG